MSLRMIVQLGDSEAEYLEQLESRPDDLEAILRAKIIGDYELEQSESIHYGLPR